MIILFVAVVVLKSSIDQLYPPIKKLYSVYDCDENLSLENLT